MFERPWGAGMDEAILTEEELRRAVREIFKRSQIDLEFRALCLSNPHEALRLTTGKAVPAELEIRFADAASDKAHGEGGS
ncbi:MAG: hypothetical protein K2Y27_19420 [Xanthobacteraceae bacterium]|nr:hypothetical protein [Xanthobacteraceae bacterium]